MISKEGNLLQLKDRRQYLPKDLYIPFFLKCCKCCSHLIYRYFIAEDQLIQHLSDLHTETTPSWGLTDTMRYEAVDFPYPTQN